MTFCIRADIDTRKGMRDGVPFLTELADLYDFDLSFYIPVGGEATLLDVLKHRGGPEEFDGDHIEKLTLPEKLRTVLYPKNYAQEYSSYLQKLRDDGHELGLHGYKHRHWTRSLEYLDLDNEFNQMINAYKSLFGEQPGSFAAPGFRTNDDVLRMLDRYDISVASDLDGEQPFHPEQDGGEYGHVQVPITLRRGRQPVIEAMRLQDKSDEAILDTIKEEVRGSEFASMYLHPSYEAVRERGLLEKVFQFLANEEEDVVTIKEAAGVVQ